MDCDINATMRNIFYYVQLFFLIEMKMKEE